MPGVRQIDPRVRAIYSIMERPGTPKGYEELAECYRSMGMEEEGEAVRSLISEKFRADNTDTNEGQLLDHRKVP